MQKTTVYLPDELKAAVTAEARRRGIAEAEVIRDAIAAAVTHPRPKGGVFASTPFADRAEELLAGFGERVIIADTSGLLALFNASEPAHAAVLAVVGASPGPLVVSPFVVAEMDYLVANRVGVDAELAVLEELAGGAYELAAFGAGDLATASSLIARYRDQAIGVTDASLVVLADRYRSREVLTLDHRHFGVVRPLSGGRFKLLP